MINDPNTEGRLRTHPEERFAATEDQIDLRDAVNRLEREASGQNGHKQVALFRGGPLTVALYALEARAALDEHVVDGPVVLHVLEGAINVRADRGANHLVQSGQLLRLAPKVAHRIEAEKPARFLMTVGLQGPGSHSLE